MKNYMEANCFFLHKEKHPPNWKSPENPNKKILLLTKELEKAKEDISNNLVFSSPN